MSTAPMNPSDFDALQNDVHALFSALYLIDVELLSAEERKQHQQSPTAHREAETAKAHRG